MTLQLVAPDHQALWDRVPDFGGNAGDLRKTARDMHALMHRTFGCGIAAPQVGLRLRMFVLDPRPFKHQQFGGARVCINPVVVHLGGPPMEAWEGCLSWPGQRVKVVRSEQIVAEYTDLRGKRIREEFFGIWARGVQHETDHLDGKCIWTRESVQQPPAPNPGPIDPPRPPHDQAVA